MYVDLLKKTTFFTSVVERRILNSEFSLKRQLVSICLCSLPLAEELVLCPSALEKRGGLYIYVVDQHEITSKYIRGYPKGLMLTLSYLSFSAIATVSASCSLS